MKIEINLSDHYMKDILLLLSRLAKYKNNKSFKDLTRKNILEFLNTFVKTEESDPLHKWIGTYNVYIGHLQRFFKWLYYPNFEPSKRPKPVVVENLPKLKRKEQFIYKPSDLRQYAEVLVNGKTGSRHIPLINSLPYIKDYLDHEHPHPSNSNAIALCGVGKSLGRSINVISLHL
jgi:hypothetical protein